MVKPKIFYTQLRVYHTKEEVASKDFREYTENTLMKWLYHTATHLLNC